MEKINILIEYLAQGSDPNNWFILKFGMAYVGGVASYLFKQEFFTTPGEVKINFFWSGCLFSIFAAFGGLFLLSPNNITGSFMSGLLGVTTLTNFITQKNEGASNPEFEEEALNEGAIMSKYEEK